MNSGHTFNVNSTGIGLTSQSNSDVSYTDHSVKNSIAVGDNRTYTNKDGITTPTTYGTIVTGRMYVDGDLAVNGFITSVNPNSASGIVVNNSGITVDGLNNTVAIVASSTGSPTGSRSQVTLKEDSAALTVTNPGTGLTHGLTVGTQSTSLSGGTRSTSLTLNDSGATFRNDSTRGPARVMGVDDGRSGYDAVNYHQLTKAYSGVASAAALAAVPRRSPKAKASTTDARANVVERIPFALRLARLVGTSVLVSWCPTFGRFRLFLHRTE